MKRSTKTAPVSLSTSYLIGSPCIGISMMTLQSSGTPLPAETRSRFMAAHDEDADRHYNGHARAGCYDRVFFVSHWSCFSRSSPVRSSCAAQHFVAANTTIVGSVILEHESSVWFNTVIRGDNDVITVGARSNG